MPQQLPPRQVPFQIVGHHPELLLPLPTQAAIVRGLIQNARDLGALSGTIMNQGEPAADSGWARLEEITLSDGKPATDAAGEPIQRLLLTDETLTAAAPVIAEALGAAMASETLRDVS